MVTTFITMENLKVEFKRKLFHGRLTLPSGVPAVPLPSFLMFPNGGCVVRAGAAGEQYDLFYEQEQFPAVSTGN